MYIRVYNLKATVMVASARNGVVALINSSPRGDMSTTSSREQNDNGDVDHRFRFSMGVYEARKIRKGEAERSGQVSNSIGSRTDPTALFGQRGCLNTSVPVNEARNSGTS